MDDGQWYVLVEDRTTGGGYSSIAVRQPVDGPLEAAQEQAALTAHEFEPLHPADPQGRQIFRLPDESWLVVVQGRVMQGSFRVYVAQNMT